jgi:hypothetical protein
MGIMPDYRGVIKQKRPCLGLFFISAQKVLTPNSQWCKLNPEEKTNLQDWLTWGVQDLNS